MKAPRSLLLGAIAAAIAGPLATGVTGGSAVRAADLRSATGGPAATLILQTVPAVKGMEVSLDGTTYRTRAGGWVAIPTTAGPHRLRILHPDSSSAGTSIRFARWRDGIALASREITVGPGTHVEQAGFVISRPIAFRFTDSGGKTVPLSQVQQVTLTNGLGQRFTFPPGRPPATFAVNRMVRGPSGLHPLPIRYSVRTVLMDGSDVVFGGSQNFYVSRDKRPWTVRVLLFPLQVRVRDALFKFPIGDAVRLTLPNGVHRLIPLGNGHDVLVPGLARGNYELVSEGPGFGLSAPTALSGPQTTTLLMLSWIDVLVIAVFAVLFLIGLPLAGGRVGRKPGHGRRLTWQAGPTRRPQPVPAQASTLGEETAGTRPGMPDPGRVAAGGTGVLNVTDVMPALWDTEAHTRGKRRHGR